MASKEFTDLLAIMHSIHVRKNADPGLISGRVKSLASPTSESRDYVLHKKQTNTIGSFADRNNRDNGSQLCGRHFSSILPRPEVSMDINFSVDRGVPSI
jgi:hypothetical protein